MGINPQRLHYVYQHADIHFLILLNGYTIFHYTFLSTPLWKYNINAVKRSLHILKKLVMKTKQFHS